MFPIFHLHDKDQPLLNSQSDFFSTVKQLKIVIYYQLHLRLILNISKLTTVSSQRKMTSSQQ